MFCSAYSFPWCTDAPNLPGLRLQFSGPSTKEISFSFSRVSHRFADFEPACVWILHLNNSFVNNHCSGAHWGYWFYTEHIFYHPNYLSHPNPNPAGVGRCE